jgi:hypothetical protein
MKLLNVITPVVSFLLTAGVTVGLSAQDAQPPNPQQEQTSDADAGQSTNDTPGAAEAAAAANNEMGADTSAEDGTASSATGISTTTSSSSGSPAVLSRNDGDERDGTNTVQRAKPNMAGSPVDGVSIPDTPGDTEGELKDRQAYSRDKEQSAATTERRMGSDQMNTNNRRENNEESDQNLSAKEKDDEGKSDRKRDKKERKKSKKNDRE